MRRGPSFTRVICSGDVKRTWTGLAIAVPTILVWGVTFVNTKALLADFSALEILAVRFALAYAALWAMCPRRLRGVPARDEAVFALAGLSGATLYQFVENLGTVRELFVIRPLLVKQTYRLTIAALGIGKLFLLPIDIT